MLLAPCSAKLSAQSPPCSRKASPAATLASDLIRLRASPANTSGGKVASCASTSASACSVRVFGTLQDRLLAPALRRPTFGHQVALHDANPKYGRGFQRAYTRARAPKARSNTAMAYGRTEGNSAEPGPRLFRHQPLDLHSAASRTWLSAFSRMVTSSSAAVGCTAMTASKSALVAFILTAMPTAWMSSPASGPTIWQPTTRSVVPSTTSFKNMRVSRPASAAFIGRNDRL